MMITVEDARRQLNIVDDADDALLTSYIAAAEALITAHVDAELVPDMTAAPAPLLQAARMLVAHWYEAREAAALDNGLTAAVEPPFGFWTLIGPYRARVF
jgi:hypothetical protein